MARNYAAQALQEVFGGVIMDADLELHICLRPGLELRTSAAAPAPHFGAAPATSAYRLTELGRSEWLKQLTFVLDA